MASIITDTTVDTAMTVTVDRHEVPPLTSGARRRPDALRRRAVATLAAAAAAAHTNAVASGRPRR